MAKTLRVINPFFIMEVGDTLELSDNEEFYVAEHNEEFHKHGDDSEDINSTFHSEFTVSLDYAKQLIEEGYLEVDDNNGKKAESSSFVNIFTEIDTLLDSYNNELKNINEDYANMPECMKVEKATVLKNMIKLLEHLKSLKK